MYKFHAALPWSKGSCAASSKAMSIRPRSLTTPTKARWMRNSCKCPPSLLTRFPVAIFSEKRSVTMIGVPSEAEWYTIGWARFFSTRSSAFCRKW